MEPTFCVGFFCFVDPFHVLTNDKSMSSNKRQFYRVHFPEQERPVCKIMGTSQSDTLLALEVSERGMTLIPENSKKVTKLISGEKIAGKIELGGVPISFSGYIKSKEIPEDSDQLEIVVVDVEGISSKSIFEEQQRLASKYSQLRKGDQ